MRQSHLILSNAAIMWAARIFLLVPQLVLVPYLIREIGESGYGVYALVWSLMMSIQQLQISLQSGVVKYSAAFLAQGKIGEVNKVVSSSFVYSLLLAVAAFTVTLAAIAFYRDPTGEIRFSLGVTGVMVLFLIPLTPYVGVIQSRQRYFIGAVAETISKYISLGLVVLWFHIAKPSVGAVVIIMAGALFFSLLAQTPIAYRLVPGLRVHPRLFNKASFRLVAAFGAATVLASLCLAVNSTGVRWLMGALVSTQFVAHLAIMIMPGLLLSQILGAMTITVMPATSGYEATGNQRMLQELLARGMRYTMILALAGVIAAGLNMRNALSLWVGRDYVFLAPYAMALFAGQSFIQGTTVAHHMLKGMSRLRAVVLIYFSALVVAPLVLILTIFHFWRDPYIAVTVGLVAGNLVCGCAQALYCAKVVRADRWGMLKTAFAQPLLVGAPVGLAAIGIVSFGGIEGLVGRAGVSAAALLAFFGACYAFIASSAERQQAKAAVHSLLSKINAVRNLRAEPDGR